MITTTINDLIAQFVKWHRDVELKHFYDKEEQIHKFTMTYGSKCIDVLVQDLCLNFAICENPLPHLFDKMATQLGVTIKKGWEYR